MKFTAKKESIRSQKNLTTLVFVDYEYLYWSMINRHNRLITTEDLETWVADLQKQGDIQTIFFYADFQKQELQTERKKLRTISRSIIDSGENTADNTTIKDHTDFIILDQIYQEHINRPNIEQFILVTGDAHFKNVARYLRIYKQKTIGLYALPTSCSRDLINAVHWYTELTPTNTVQTETQFIEKAVLQKLQELNDSGKIATFAKTRDSLSAKLICPPQIITSVLKEMLERGVIHQVLLNNPHKKGDSTNALMIKN